MMDLAHWILAIAGVIVLAPIIVLMLCGLAACMRSSQISRQEEERALYTALCGIAGSEERESIDAVIGNPPYGTYYTPDYLVKAIETLMRDPRPNRCPGPCLDPLGSFGEQVDPACQWPE